MALIDNVISPVNASLLANLAWLDNAYGQVQKMVRKDSVGNVVAFPGVYTGKGADDYISLLPDESIGNYCFWDIDPEAEYLNENRAIRPRFNFKLVFWFDWRDIYGDWQNRSMEEVKNDILNVLTASRYTRNIEIFKISENAEEIFDRYTQQYRSGGYTSNEIETQYLMRPFGGLAIIGTLIGTFGCNDQVLQPPVVPPAMYLTIPTNYSIEEQVWPYDKYFGETIYWRTWFPEGPSLSYVELDGMELPLPGVLVKGEVSYNSIPSNSKTVNFYAETFAGYPGSDTHLSVQYPYESGDFRVTLWYTKTQPTIPQPPK